MAETDYLEPMGPTALAPFAETPDEALEAIFGFESFREGQRRVVEHLMGGDDALVVMPTGSGKSLCYQLTGALKRGVTLVVSPLIALMKDQVDALRETGLPATEINSSMSWEQQQDRIAGLRAGDYKIVYVAPERFRSSSFCDALRDIEVGLFAIDEAHCISQWGHDFRPDYRQLADVREGLGEPQTVALTATATEFVQRDIVEQLGTPEADIIVSGFERPNLYFEVYRARGKSDKLDRLEALLDYHDGDSVIVYCTTRKQVRQVQSALEGRDVDAGRYHAGIDDERRSRLQERWMADELPVLVATNAFGMGVDKPDVRAVVHFNMPGSIEAYYQEAGRAGRDGEDAHCVLMFNYADTGIHEWFADNSYPTRQEIVRVWEFVANFDPGETLPDDIEALGEAIGDRTTVHSMAAESALKQLARANHIEPTAEGVRILEDVDASELRVDFDEIDRRREIAHEQVENVADYASSSACCQAALLEHFGSEPAFGERCGHCSNCAPPPAYAAANAESLSQTVATRDDPKTVLEKVLSGVARARGRRGASAVAGMLVGSRAKPVLEADFDELSTYGILDDIRNKDASYLIELMGRHGLIRRNEYGCVLLTEAGWEVVRGDRAPPDALAAALERSVRDPSELPTGRRSSGSAGTGETYRRTLELHRQGLSVEEVAERRDLTARTIRNHVVTLAARGEDLDLEVDPERLETLRGVASDWTNGDRLRPLKDALPDDWSYPMLKRHLAALLQERESSR